MKQAENIQKGVVMVAAGDIVPHPDNPRGDLGDLTELAASIGANGIMQNLTVVANPDKEGPPFMAVVGHRRLAAAVLAGMEQVPAIVAEMSKNEQIAMMLTENLQRADLTVLEQAQSFQLMLDLGETVQTVAEMTGFSAATVKHRVEIARVGKESVKDAMRKGFTIMDFAKLEKIKDVETREKLIENNKPADLDWAVKRQAEKDLTAERFPAAEEMLNAFAKEYKKSIGYQGLAGYEEWKEFDIAKTEPEIPAPEDSDKVKYVYHWNEYGQKSRVTIYREGGKNNLSEAEIQKQADEKAYKERVKEITAIEKRAQERRFDFAKTIAGNRHLLKEHTIALLFAISARLSTGYEIQSRGRNLLDILGIARTENAFISDRGAYDEVLSKGKTLDQIIFAQCYPSFDSGVSFSSQRVYEFKIYPVEDIGHYPYRSRSMIVYDLLAAYGYEMADEERAYVDGTHELYDTDIPA